MDDRTCQSEYQDLMALIRQSDPGGSMQLSDHAKEMLDTLVSGDPWAQISGVRDRVMARFTELGGHVEEQGPDQEFQCPRVDGIGPGDTRCKISGLRIGINSPSPFTCQAFREMKDPADVVSELGAEVNALVIVMMDILGCDIADVVEGIADQYNALQPRPDLHTRTEPLQGSAATVVPEEKSPLDTFKEDVANLLRDAGIDLEEMIRAFEVTKTVEAEVRIITEQELTPAEKVAILRGVADSIEAGA